MTWGEPAYEWVGDWTGKRASLSPDRTAIVDEGYGESYTYAALDRRANRTARLLEANGVVDGSRVALVTRNRIEMIDLFAACGKTGGVLAPLSYRLAPPELAELLELIDPQLLVIESPYVERLEHAIARASVEPTVLEIETDEPAGGWGIYDDELPADGSPVASCERSLGDPHLLLHTGGSTGTPKETTITHGSIHWNAFNTITAWGLRPDDIAPMVFPSFHTGGWNVLTLPILAMGGTLLIDREVDPGRVLEQVESEGATVLVAVPAVLRTMARHEDWASTDLSTLRFAKSGGGPCRDSIVQAWRERGVDLTQGYGLTEIGPNNFAMPDEFEPEKVASVGRPAPYVDARIVDEDGSPVEHGEIGELELSGPHAAAGYWGNETETAETFGEGWISTGDLARVDEDGYYHIEGRKKNMFVSGGENVFPPEVEDAVADHPAVEEVVVIGVPDETWGTVGKAVVEGDESLTIEELEAFLDGRIARFKIPAALAFVDEMPTSGPSKLDREAIAAEFGESA
ncbi:acyl-CoA synthetase (AMP-forming)/AMP-acid ligase II [Halovivax ruber XH-70]|uniref:Acyl-CoA synthetase (AMP-forming)/AMP-acid ligase II n=1 Tax=Halovivax ruber (strain DSM 18193 / JCM 13892 / XH-70) TaxID=797302 RepID=L0IFA7_HALRX|nr:AMP-binding protein [Halovivax ruber]AGB16657.1 acyl-CoA synthetase (AMP-forming)/AMP-acid ligase II [Halovivax ruber XH-70]